METISEVINARHFDVWELGNGKDFCFEFVLFCFVLFCFARAMNSRRLLPAIKYKIEKSKQSNR
jgi:hypothetical protein